MTCDAGKAAMSTATSGHTATQWLAILIAHAMAESKPDQGRESGRMSYPEHPLSA